MPTIKMDEKVFDKLAYLAGCGIDEGAGSDEDMKRILKHVRKKNKAYGDKMRKAVAENEERTRQHKKASKETARGWRGKTVWLQKGDDFFDVKVLEWRKKKGGIYGVWVEYQGTMWDRITKAVSPATMPIFSYYKTGAREKMKGKKTLVDHVKLFTELEVLGAMGAKSKPKEVDNDTDQSRD